MKSIIWDKNREWKTLDTFICDFVNDNKNVIINNIVITEYLQTARTDSLFNIASEVIIFYTEI